jgi:hypothetical protein
MPWTRSLDRLLQKVLAANRKASATASTDAFDRLKAIADEGIMLEIRVIDKRHSFWVVN